jgi:hypothetical protein
MAIAPAICPKCGTVFSSGLDVKALAEIVNCQAGPCPKCGGMGDILSGFYAAVSESVLHVAATDLDQFATLIEILTEAQRKKLASKVIADLIAATLPKFKAVAEYIRANKEDVYKILALLIATLGFVYSRLEASNKGGIADGDVQQLIDEAIVKACKSPQERAAAKKERTQRQKAKLAQKAKEKQRKQQRRR